MQNTYIHLPEEMPSIPTIMQQKHTINRKPTYICAQINFQNQKQIDKFIDQRMNISAQTDLEK